MAVIDDTVKGRLLGGQGENMGTLELGDESFPHHAGDPVGFSSKLRSRPVQGMPESHAPMEGEGHRTHLPVLQSAALSSSGL